MSGPSSLVGGTGIEPGCPAWGGRESVRAGRRSPARSGNTKEGQDNVSALSSVGGTGIEPATSSVSGKRATAAPTAQIYLVVDALLRTHSEVTTGFEPVYTALQAVASPLGHATACGKNQKPQRRVLTLPTRADDEIRTRDPHLGKVMRYHCATSACPHFCVL